MLKTPYRYIPIVPDDYDDFDDYETVWRNFDADEDEAEHTEQKGYLQ